MSRLFLLRRVSAAFLFTGLVVIGLGFLTGQASAQATGTITGRVLIGKEPGGFANVIVLGSRRGAQADENGNFTITLVPVGSATLKVQMQGYESKTVTVTVNAGTNTAGTINLGGQQKVVKEIESPRHRRPPHLTGNPRQKQTVSQAGPSGLPCENLREAVGLKDRHREPGATAPMRGGRGGRSSSGRGHRLSIRCSARRR
jgi:hypothetical protein